MDTQVTRRQFTVAIAAAAGSTLLASRKAWARAFPTRPVTLICPWPPGGGADAQMRALAEATSKVLGQKVVIENKPGAVGTLGPSALVSARPDGYLLSQSTNAVFRQPFITRTAYDPKTDFTYLLGITGFQFGLVVQAKSPWRSLAQFVDYAKQNPGKVTFGTFGVGSPPHVVMDRIAAANGIQWTHIPFKGTSENIAQLLGGHISASADGTGWAAHVDSGALRVLAVFGDKRLKRWPNVPTLRESGYDIAESSPWGIIGPKSMAPEVVKILHDAFKAGMEDPAFLAVLDSLAQEPLHMTGEEYRRYAMAQIPYQQKIVETYGLAKK
jgi:tripartite-type tricarboxylate transporter receptor subunit TctC